jgi:Domain of unknown function (DUF6431)
VAIVWPCLLGVDAYAAAGRAVKVPRPGCPGCERPMGFWPGYLRWVRYGRTRRIWVRRATCRRCRVSHALLPAFLLARRLDAIEAIGAGLAWAVRRRGMRPVAAWLGMPPRPRGTGVGASVPALPPWPLGLPPWRSSWPGASPEAAALAALGVVWVGVSARLGVTAPGVWPLAALVSGGAWLQTTTPQDTRHWRDLE